MNSYLTELTGVLNQEIAVGEELSRNLDAQGRPSSPCCWKSRRASLGSAC